MSFEEVAWLQQHHSPILIHNESDWKPFNFNEAGEAKGYSVDYMNHITKTSLFVLNSNNSISDLDDLAVKKPDLLKGFFGEFIRKSYPKIEIITFDSILASFVGVEKGLVDAAIEVPVVCQRVLRESKLNTVKLGGVLTDPRFITTFSVATRKDNHILSSIIQKGIDAVSPDEELLIRRKWKIEEMDASILSEDEEVYLAQLNTLNVCVNPDRLPLEAVNIDGTLTGVSSEFLKLLEEQMEIPFTLVLTKNWSETLRLAKKGMCDLLPMITKTRDRQEYLNFTSPWLVIPVVVATRQDQIYISNITQVTEHEFGVVEGLAINEILRSAYPELKLINVRSVKEGLRMVKDGALFGLIDTIPAISRTLQVDSVTSVKISGDVGLNTDFAIGVRRDDTQLLGIVEKSLATIDTAVITNIYNRWLAVAYIDRFDYTRFWQVIAGFIIFTFYLLYRYRRGLQITAELRKAHTEVEKINVKLVEQARTDALTGIANRLRIDEQLYQELTRFERTHELFSIILLDIDHFKQVNDNYGHHIGDQVLMSIAVILKQNTRPYDLAGRWGGEEFLVICPSTTGEGIMSLAEHLRLAIMSNTSEKLPLQTASFGVATIRTGDSAKDLIRRADDALYRAKQGGRNRVES